MMVMMFFVFNCANEGHDHVHYDGDDVYLVVGEDNDDSDYSDDGDLDDDQNWWLVKMISGV